MAKKISQQEATATLMAQHHRVSHAASVKMVKRYQKARKALASSIANGSAAPADFPSLSICYSFNATALKRLLKKPGCAGLRIYPAINDQNEVTLILVGFDEAGNNISPKADTSPLAKAAVKTKASKEMALKSVSDDDDTLDETQICPPFPAPLTP